MAANKVHVEKFLKLLQKVTLNWSIPHIRVKFKTDEYKSNMKGSSALLIVKGDNDIISGISPTDEWEMNFQDTVKNVKSYLSIVVPDEDGNAIIEMKDEKIVIKSGRQKTQCFFCADNIPTVADREGPRTEGDEVCNFSLDEQFITAYSTIKKVANTFGKVYFGVEGGKFFIEAGDRTSPHSNNMKISLQDVSYDDMFVCFDFKSLNDVMTLIGTTGEDFVFKLGYMSQRHSGLVSFKKGDEEVFYLLSLRENT